MGVAKDGLRGRQAQTEQELGKLALERVRLTRRIEELDRSIFAMQVVIQANSLALKELDADETIRNAKEFEAATMTAETIMEVNDNA